MRLGVCCGTRGGVTANARTPCMYVCVCVFRCLINFSSRCVLFADSIWVEPHCRSTSSLVCKRVLNRSASASAKWTSQWPRCVCNRHYGCVNCVRFSYFYHHNSFAPQTITSRAGLPALERHAVLLEAQGCRMPVSYRLQQRARTGVSVPAFHHVRN